jgi:hypothetical protein
MLAQERPSVGLTLCHSLGHEAHGAYAFEERGHGRIFVIRG